MPRKFIPVLSAAIVAAAFSANLASAQLIVGTEDENQPVFHVDVATNFATPLFTPINNGIDFAGIEGLDVDDAGRTIYFTSGTTTGVDREILFSAHYDDPDPDLPGQLRVRKVADLTYNGVQLRVTGLAWDSTNNRLLTSYEFGVGPEGIYEINTSTGEMTLLLDLDPIAADIAYGGLAHNPADGFLYATNQDFGNVFIDRIDLTQPAATARTQLVNAPILSDGEGLAISPAGLAYVVPPDSGDIIQVFNIGTDTFEPDLGPTPFTQTLPSSSGGGWGPNALSPTPGPNFCIVASANPPEGQDIEAGDQIIYSIRNQNCGNVAATSGVYVMTLSGSAAATATIDSVVSDTGAAMETVPDTEVSGTVDGVFAGFQDNVTITVTTGSPGDLVLTCTFDPSPEADAYAGNNTEVLSHNIRIFPAAKAIASNLTGKSSALAPGLGGAEYDTTLSRPFRSPDGTRIAFEASTNFGGSTTDDDVVVRYDNGVGALISQENNTLITGLHLVDNTDERMSVNNNGFVAFAGDSTQSSADDFVVYSDGTTLTPICFEDQVVPNPAFAPNGWDYGSTQFSSSITGDNNVLFNVEFMGGGIPSTQNTAFFRSNPDGSAVETVLWEGVSIPAGQAGGATETWEDGDTDKQWADGAGCNYITSGDLTGSTTGDEVVIVNGTVVIQEGETLAGTGLTGTIPGSFGTVTSGGVSHVEMNSNGDWFAIGITSVSDEDWIVKGNGTNFSLLARNGDEIISGTGEFWSDIDGFSPTFRAVAGNNQGDYAIMGRTTEPNTLKNMVVVLNGTDEVIREGDPVALDADGLFDDDAFVGLPNSNEMILTDGGELIFNTQLLDNGGTDIGDAIVTVDVSALVSPPLTGADLSVIKTASTSFVPNVGAPITYTVTVCNAGPDDATDVMANDTLPAQVAFSSATMGATEVMPGMVEANLGTIPAYTSKSFEIVVQTTAEGEAVNTASAFANENDPNNANDTGTATTTIENQVDVGVSKIDNGGAPIGQQYDYTVTVTNAGPADATNVVVRDTLPVEVSYVTSSLPDDNPDDGIVDVTIANVPAGGQVDYTITVQVDAATQLAINDLSVLSLNEVDTDPANDTFQLETINGDVADLVVAMADSGLANLGEDVTYTIDVSNIGPGTANNVVVVDTLPGDVNLVSVSEPFVEAPPGVLTIDFASIANGAAEQITIVVTPLSEGTYLNTVTASSDEVDPDDADNTAFTSTRVGNFRQILPIYTRISGHPTATVPGLLDAADQPVFGEFDSLTNINVSEDGSRWTIDASSDLAVSSIDSVMMLGSGFVGTVFAQEGKQVADAPAGIVYTFFDDEVGFDSNNDFAWGAIVTGGGITDITYTNIGGVNTNIGQTGDSISNLLDLDPNPSGDETITNSMVSEHLLNDGRVGFAIHGLANLHSSRRPVTAYWDNLNGIVGEFQSGVSIFDGITMRSMPLGRTFQTTPDGMHFLLRTTDGPDTISDVDMLVVDDSVVIHNGDVLASGQTVDAVFDAQMVSTGDWIARGDDPLNDDWAVRNGVQVAATGGSVVGDAETWGNSISTARINTTGDYLIIGNTSEADTDFDTVMVLNGTDILVRESDPVDLNGNGLFDDGVFINSFVADDAYISNDQIVHFLANLKDTEGTNLFTAFLVLDASTGCPTIAGDIDGDGDGDGADVQGAVTCLVSMDAMGGQCSCLDYNSSGGSDVGDIADFVADLLDN